MTFPINPPGILYIVSTPIGNLADISLRAVETLKSASLVLSEDTRVTGKLLSHYHIQTRQLSFHDHNEKTKTPIVIDILLQGKSAALVSDAGTPLISDPGYSLVNAAIKNNIEIVPIPGASSILAALVASGFPSDRFVFEGYAPRTEGKLRRFFGGILNEPRTIVIFETPHRIKKCLNVMLEVMGNREIFIGRELTKKFEEKIRGNLEEVCRKLEGRSLKGEIVVIIKANG